MRPLLLGICFSTGLLAACSASTKTNSDATSNDGGGATTDDGGAPHSRGPLDAVLVDAAYTTDQDGGTHDAGSIAASVSACAFSDEVKSEHLTSNLGGFAVATDAEGTTSVYAYVEKSLDEAGKSELRRYTLTSSAPCTLTRDPAFSLAVSFPRGVASDGKGGVYAYGMLDVGVRRVVPTPLDCDGVTAADVLAIDRDGAVGYAGSESGSIITKLQFGATCTSTPLAVHGNPAFDHVTTAAVDAQGRLHAQVQLLNSFDQRVFIFDATGAFVKSYGGGAFYTSSLTRCTSGICAGSSSSAYALTADGDVLARVQLTDTFLPTLSGNASGPTLLAGSLPDQTGGSHVAAYLLVGF